MPWKKSVSWWKDLSISKKLYTVVGIMALLIAMELLMLRFAMTTLSAVRAFVGAEGSWSKAQKNAAFRLQRFALTRNEADYHAYLAYLQTPEGDHRARLELFKKDPNFEIVAEAFKQGHVHPDDIPPIISLLRRFYWVSYLDKAIKIWTQGDNLLEELKEAGSEYHRLVKKGKNPERLIRIMSRIREINEELTILEDNFSQILGEGSRWLENLVISLLFAAVLTVESIGITLTFFTSRSLSQGLRSISTAATKIGEGQFHYPISIHSNDELGQLAASVSAMGRLLQKSYTSLEERVNERTSELSAMAEENKKLYEEAKAAIQIRDDFLSIASHELRTPLTSLSLQIQMANRALKDPDAESVEKVAKNVEVAEKQMKRLLILLDQLLDVTRISAGHLVLERSSTDLKTIVLEAVDRARAERSLSTISVQANESFLGNWDPIRLDQVISNLISNAIKYGEGKPIAVSLRKEQKDILFSVRDQGSGVPEHMQDKIFERFERAVSGQKISGLGLGLYISSQIVEAHGGKLEVNSEMGKGSVFTVRLPYA